MSNLYSDAVLEHFHHPKHLGVLDQEAPNVATAQCKRGQTVDVMQLQIAVNASQVIAEAKFLVQGSVPLVAIGSMMCDHIIGKTLDEASKLTSQEIMAWCELPEVKKHCALLAEDLLKAVLNNAKKA